MPGAGAAATGKADAGPKTVDPIICEGPRMMRLNDRQISVDGDAITYRFDVVLQGEGETVFFDFTTGRRP